MAYIPTVLYPSNVPPTAGVVLYTVPASTSVIVKNIVMTNVTGSEAQITLNVVTSAGAPLMTNRILSNFGVPANGVSTLDCSIVIPEGGYLFGSNTTSGAIVLTISGVEVS